MAQQHGLGSLIPREREQLGKARALEERRHADGAAVLAGDHAPRSTVEGLDQTCHDRGRDVWLIADQEHDAARGVHTAADR
jgi:hypothetical protein